MRTMARLIVYTFDDEEALALQMGRSQNEGTLVVPRGRIAVLNLPESLLHLIGEWAHDAAERFAELPEVEAR